MCRCYNYVCEHYHEVVMLPVNGKYIKLIHNILLVTQHWMLLLQYALIAFRKNFAFNSGMIMLFIFIYPYDYRQ